MSGRLFLVVGPSGAGKDSLIDGAKEACQNDPWVCFPKRFITRDADAGGEDHIPLTPSEFAKKREQGEFILHWQAHDLHYGIDANITRWLESGRNVVVNVSRSVLDEARAKFDAVTILSISVNDDQLRARLKARGRESDTDIEKRIQRANAYQISGDDVVTIHNNGALEESIIQFTDALRIKDAAQS